MIFKIHLLGQFKLQANNHPLELPSRPAQSLLAYLVLNAGVTHRREKLASLLWPESSETNARSYLRQALWRIRKSLGSASLTWQDYLHINDISVTFNSQSDYWLDAELMVMPTESHSVEEMIEIISLYQGELLPGFYDEWIVMERDHLHAAYHQKMNLLLENLVDNRKWDEVLRWSEEWIMLGYSPEPAYRALMCGYVGLGDQTMVVATYRRCVEALDRELDLEPSLETEQLFEQLRGGERAVSETVPAFSAPSSKSPAFLYEDTTKVEKTLFVARESELTQLDSFLHQAKTGRGQVVFITGEAGSGKTSLIQEFTQHALDTYSDVILAKGNCNAHSGLGDPYLPFREILELLTGDVESRWAAGAITTEHARRLWKTIPLTTQAILDVGPDLIDTLIAGSALMDRTAIGSPKGDEHLEKLRDIIRRKSTGPVDPSPQQQNLFNQYTRVLHELSQQATLVLIIDDLQWADTGSINLLFHIGREITGFNILLVGAYRPEEVALERSGERHPLEPVVNELKRQYGEITVNLDKVGSQKFIEAVLDSEPNLLGSSFREMFFKQTAGHPLFTVELLRGLQERGDLIRDQNGFWIEGLELEWDKIPGRVEAVIAERIGRLKNPMQDVLRIASVEGEVFTAEVIAHVLETDPREMLSCLSTELEKKHRLVKAHSILRRNGQLLSSYRFQHILFQKYLYSSMDEIERVHLHEHIGMTLEGLYEDQEGRFSIAPQLVRHFHEARITTKEIDYLLQAGKRANQMSAYEEAISHLSKSLDLLMTQPATKERAEKELVLQLALGQAWIGPTGYGKEVESAFTRVRQLCEQMGKNQILCQVLGQLSVVHFVHAEYAEARNLAEEALRLAEQLNEPIYIALGHWYLGFIWFYLSDYKKVRAHLKHVLDYYDPQQHHNTLVVMRGADAGISALSYEALCLWILGYPDQANKKGQEVIALAQELDHPFTLVDVLCYAGCILGAMQHDTQKLSYYAEQMAEIALNKNFAGWSGQAISFLGEALARQGRYKEGIEKIREGITYDISISCRCSLVGAYRGLAEAQLVAGLPQEGLITINEAFTFVESTDEHLWEPELYRLQAGLLLLQNDEDRAEACLQKSIEIANQQNAKSWELRSTVDLACLWWKQDKKEKAKKDLSAIYDWFTEGFDTPDLKNAKMLLEEIS